MYSFTRSHAHTYCTFSFLIFRYLKHEKFHKMRKVSRPYNLCMKNIHWIERNLAFQVGTLCLCILEIVIPVDSGLGLK